MYHQSAHVPQHLAGEALPLPSHTSAHPLHRLARPTITLLLTLLALLLPRPGPAAALYVAPTGPTEILSAGDFHTCALTPSGAVACWGNNDFDQVGGVHAGPYSQINAGYYHTCALTPAGAAECWGWNVEGQVGGIHAGPYSQVSAGYHHTCALTPSGAVECWGNNGDGQAGNHLGPYSQVSTGLAHTCARTPSGAVECWGLNNHGQIGGTNGVHAGPYSQVSAGAVHTCALTPAGAVECWGWNAYSQGGTHAGPYVQVSAGCYHTCALTPGGAVECWGDNTYDQTGNANGVHAGPYTQVTTGRYHTCALKPSGPVECWGGDVYDQVGGANGIHAGPYRPPQLPEIVSAGGYHTCALRPAGAVECWGLNNDGQAVGQPGPFIQVSAGGSTNAHTCALKPAGAAECWGFNLVGQADYHAGPYTQVSLGRFHTCALKPSGVVECWGFDNYGQSGTHAGPYVQVSAGDLHTCAVTPAGAVECWGRNDSGQVGGANGYHAGPYTQVSAGGSADKSHTCALTPTGAVECWGDDSFGQAGSAHAGPYSQVSAGQYYTCALTTAGAVECWGDNGEGQVGGANGVHAGPYIQVTTGFSHTCALKPAGAVECWGLNDDGQVGGANGHHTGPFGPYVPETSITVAPPTLSNSNDPSFQFTSPDTNATFECRLDGGAWAACASPQQLSDLSDGSHTFEARAVSPPGNPDTTPASHTWTIDTAAPATTITAAPPDPSDSPDATFQFTSEAGATFECRLDGGAWAACASPKTYIGLADGEHTFEARATDAAGNTGPADGHTWTIDTTTPVYLSATTTGSAGNVPFGPHDILLRDDGVWSKWFDGTAAQLKPNGNAMHNINALWIPDTAGDDVVLAFAQDARAVPGVSGQVDGTDLVWWNGSAFSLWFDGQDVGLSVLAKEKIDALHVLDGSLSPIGGSCEAYLLISTAGDGKVPNHSGGEIKFDGTDVLGFCLTNSGANTAGFWHRVLNGKAEGMPGQALVNLSADDDGQVLYLTTKGAFNVDSAHGSHSMVYRYDLGSGQFSGPYFSAPAEGLNRPLDGLQVDGQLP